MSSQRQVTDESGNVRFRYRASGTGLGKVGIGAISPYPKSGTRGLSPLASVSIFEGEDLNAPLVLAREYFD
jgi:hypothetical protein